MRVRVLIRSFWDRLGLNHAHFRRGLYFLILFLGQNFINIIFYILRYPLKFIVPPFPDLFILLRRTKEIIEHFATNVYTNESVGYLQGIPEMMVFLDMTVNFSIFASQLVKNVG